MDTDYTEELEHELETHRFELEVSLHELQEKNVLLKEREEFLSSMLENASEGIVVINTHGIIQSVNHAMAELVGYDTNSLPGKPLGLFLPKDIKPDLFTYIISGHNKEHKFKKTTKLVQRNIGKETHVHLSISKIGDNTGFLVILTDITEKVTSMSELEKERQEKKALLETNHELELFVQRVAHDLKTPLSSSMGLLDITEKEKDVTLIAHYHLLQRDNLKRMKGFIDNLLAYSRNRSTGLTIKKVNIQGMVSDIIDSQRHTEVARGIEFKMAIEQNDIFSTDPMRVGVVMNNLLSNAIKYSDPNKKKKTVEVLMSSSKDFADILIRDNGIGIEKEYLDDVFKPFFRATELSNGSGIGLALVKEALDKLHGTMEVESEYRKGTTFKICLPALSR